MSPRAGVSPHPDAIRAVLALVQPGLAQMETSLAGLAENDDAVLGPMLSTVLPGTGKRLRPALSLLIGRMGTASDGALNHMAVGVELLHTASLVHDDIVDESDTRHGGATLYARVGNALAVLVGDYLFSQAAQECVATGDLQVVRLFAETLGAMAQGQILDANRQLGGHHAWQTVTRDRYFRTIRGKTASLFVLACQGTGQLVGMSPPQVTRVGRAALPATYYPRSGRPSGRSFRNRECTGRAKPHQAGVGAGRSAKRGTSAATTGPRGAQPP